MRRRVRLGERRVSRLRQRRLRWFAAMARATPTRPAGDLWHTSAAELHTRLVATAARHYTVARIELPESILSMRGV